MKKTEVEIVVHNVNVPVSAVPLKTAYLCADCGNLFEGEQLAPCKYGSCCPLCESRSIYPIAGWLNATRNNETLS